MVSGIEAGSGVRKFAKQVRIPGALGFAGVEIYLEGAIQEVSATPINSWMTRERSGSPLPSDSNRTTAINAVPPG